MLSGLGRELDIHVGETANKSIEHSWIHQKFSAQPQENGNLPPFGVDFADIKNERKFVLIYVIQY